MVRAESLARAIEAMEARTEWELSGARARMEAQIAEQKAEQARQVAAREAELKQTYAQAGADAVVQGLRERGLLREKPATRGKLKKLIRDETGQITGVIEMNEDWIEDQP